MSIYSFTVPTRINMQLQNQIIPTPEQIKALLNLPKDQPVVMVNILKYKGDEGKKSYQRYQKNVLPFLKKVKGKLIWKGKSLHTVIGDAGSEPDSFMLVEYPSITNFMEMISDPAYQEIAKDRSLGLTYGGLIATETEYLMEG